MCVCVCVCVCMSPPPRSASVLKVGMVDVDVCVLSHLKEELAWATDKRLRVISTIVLFIVLRS